MPHSHTLTARVSTAWTNSKPLGLRAVVRGTRLALGPHTDCCCCGCIPVVIHCNLTPLQRTPGKAIVQPSHTQAVRCHAVTCTLAAVVVVNSLTVTHHQRTDLGYPFVANFRYLLIRESLIFATFSGAGMGSAYTRDDLYASIYHNPKSEVTQCMLCYTVMCVCWTASSVSGAQGLPAVWCEGI